MHSTVDLLVSLGLQRIKTVLVTHDYSFKMNVKNISTEIDFLQVLFTDTLPFKFIFPTFLLSILPAPQNKKDLYLSTTLHSFFMSPDFISLE